MLKKIIDFFKRLFGIKTKSEETVAVVAMAKAVTRSEVEDEEEKITPKTKVLINNCIRGYDLIKFNI